MKSEVGPSLVEIRISPYFAKMTPTVTMIVTSNLIKRLNVGFERYEDNVFSHL